MHPSFNNSIALRWDHPTQSFGSILRKELSWSVSDAATLYGALLVERFRTYGGKHLDLTDHKERLLLGASQFAIDVPTVISEFDANAARLLELNKSVVQHMGDVGMVFLLSPGETSDGTTPLGTRPTCMMHLIELPYRKFAKWYTDGTDLSLGSNRVVPSDCWSNQLKSRSRLPYFLSDAVAAKNNANSLAVLTTMRGTVSDTSVANLIVVDSSGQFISPKMEDILVGRTLRVVERLLQKCDIAIQFRDVQPSDLANASEVLLTGSTGGVWFANTFDGLQIGTANERRQYKKVSQLWKEHVGMDYVAQAVANASTNERLVLH